MQSMNSNGEFRKTRSRANERITNGHALQLRVVCYQVKNTRELLKLYLV